MSLAAKLLNVFAVPGEVFNDVKTTPRMVSNWLVPVVLGALVGAVWAVLQLSQPTFQKQFHDWQHKFIDQAEKTRKLSPQEQNIVEKMTGPTMVRICGATGAVAGSFIGVLWWGLYSLVHRTPYAQGPGGIWQSSGGRRSGNDDRCAMWLGCCAAHC